MLLPSLQSPFLLAVWGEFSWQSLKLPESTSTGMWISLQWWYQCLLARDLAVLKLLWALFCREGKKGKKTCQQWQKIVSLCFIFLTNIEAKKYQALLSTPKAVSPLSLAGLQALLCLFSAAAGGDSGLCIFLAPHAVRRGVSPTCESWWQSALPRAGSCLWASRQASTWQTQACDLGVPISSIPLFQQAALMYIDNKGW